MKLSILKLNSALRLLSNLASLALMAGLVGCYQGQTSKEPPIHINPNMDDQPKYQAQAESKFFAIGQAMQMPIKGTIAFGHLHEDMIYYTGKDSKGKLIRSSPVAPTLENLKRGQDRFNIYCAPCHSKIGDGQGMIVKRGMFPPPTYHQERLRVIEDGHIFDVITNGIRNMPSYKSQVPVADRWAIVNYVRTLQRSHNASASDVPEEVRKTIK